jgi:hypothetical protein
MLPTLVRRVLPRSDLAISCWKAQCRLVLAVHEEEGSRVTACGRTCFSGREEITSPLSGVQVESLRQPTIGPASSLLPASVQLLPVVVHAPRLLLVCADGSSSAQWTICVSSLHLQTQCREEARKGRWACIVTLLAVHTASGHEAEGDGSFHEKPQRRLPLYGAVPSAPAHAAPPSATLKREDRLPGASLSWFLFSKQTLHLLIQDP